MNKTLAPRTEYWSNSISCFLISKRFAKTLILDSSLSVLSVLVPSFDDFDPNSKDAFSHFVAALL